MEITEYLFFALELLGTVSFAVSGAIVAIEKRADLFGVVFLGILTAVGGGAIRDVLLGRFPPVMFTEQIYVTVAAASALAVFLAAALFKDRYLRKTELIDHVNNVFDALGLGAFTITGAQIAIAAGYGGNGFIVVCLGLVTGTGGGMLRDTLVQNMPFVLKKRVYAVASMVGGLLYWLLCRAGLHGAVATALGVLTVFGLRMLATVFRWNLPKAIR